MWSALAAFGAPLEALGITQDDFVKPEIVAQFGMPPNRIDVLTGISGLSFPDAWRDRLEGDFAGIRVPFSDANHSSRTSARAAAQRISRTWKRSAQTDPDGFLRNAGVTILRVALDAQPDGVGRRSTTNAGALVAALSMNGAPASLDMPSRQSALRSTAPAVADGCVAPRLRR